MKKFKIKKYIGLLSITLGLKAFLVPVTFAQNNPVPKKNAPDTSQSEMNVAAPRLPNEIHTHGFGIGLGETFLVGDFEKHGENTITFDFFYSYAASHSFDLLLNVHHSKHSFGNQQALLQGANFGIKAKLYQFDSFSPFILGGLGFYRPKVRRPINGVTVESEGKTTFGAHFGFGGDLRLNEMFTAGLLLHYHNPFDVKQVGADEVEGSYFKLLITLMYTI